MNTNINTNTTKKPPSFNLLLFSFALLGFAFSANAESDVRSLESSIRVGGVIVTEVANVDDVKYGVWRFTFTKVDPLPGGQVQKLTGEVTVENPAFKGFKAEGLSFSYDTATRKLVITDNRRSDAQVVASINQLLGSGGAAESAYNALIKNDTPENFDKLLQAITNATSDYIVVSAGDDEGFLIREVVIDDGGITISGSFLEGEPPTTLAVAADRVIAYDIPGLISAPNEIPDDYQPKSPNEPALRLAVPAGNSRTVHLKGANGTEGIALIEFFALGDANSAGAAPLGNLSTRGYIGTGDNVLIAGIIVEGTGTKRVLITGRGASVKTRGNIQNTTLRVVNQSTKKDIATSDDYASEKQSAEIKATNKVKTIAATDAAVILELEPGAYTALVSGKGGTTGIGIVEIFDLEPGTPARIINLSTRGLVGTGDKVMIGGLIAAGKSGEYAGVLVKGKSPSSPAFKAGSWLADPRFEIYNGPNKILENDNWTKP